MPFIEVEDSRLFYDVTGKGLSIVLIHGAWASHEWWRWQVLELSKEYKVLSLDVRGHGQSSPLKAVYSVSIRLVGDDYPSTVVDTISVGPYPYSIAITPDGSYVYVANAGDDTVSVIGF